jgi:hypothetical protein
LIPRPAAQLFQLVEAMPRHSLLSSRRVTKENLFGSGTCTLFSHRVTYSLHDGGSHGINLAMAGVMHPKTSCASIIWNWLSCNLGDWMTIVVSAYQRRIIRELIACENRRQHSNFDVLSIQFTFEASFKPRQPAATGRPLSG